MRPTIIRTIAILATAFSAACSAGDAVAPVTRQPVRAASALRAADEAVGEASRSIESVEWVPCAANGAGEYVNVSGQLHYHMHRIQDGNGVYHLEIRANTSQLTGTGATTGDSYRGSESEHVTARAADYYGRQSLRIAENFRFVALGGGANFTIRYDTHVEVDASGNTVLWVESQRISCD